MKSKLIGVSLTALAFSAWWMGCSGSTANNAATAVDSGPAETGGGNPEAGIPETGGQDAPADTGVDSALTGPFVDISYGVASCPAFTPCGGDPKGTWNVTGGCISEAAFDAAKMQCPGLMESNVKFKARGNVTATATTIARHTEVKFSATLAIPKACKDGVPGATCAVVGQALVAFGGLATATCTDDAVSGGCNCDVSDSTTDQTMAEAYTTSGNTLSTAGPPARTFDYCVAGNEIKYKETTAKAVPAIFILKK